MSRLRFHLHKLEAPRYGRAFRHQKFGRIIGVSYLILHRLHDPPKDTMRLTPWYLAAIAPLAVAGCSGAFFGHFAVLAVTLGIFFGTLSLGRHAVAREEPTKVDVRRAS